MQLVERIRFGTLGTNPYPHDCVLICLGWSLKSLIECPWILMRPVALLLNCGRKDDCSVQAVLKGNWLVKLGREKHTPWENYRIAFSCLGTVNHNRRQHEVCFAHQSRSIHLVQSRATINNLFLLYRKVKLWMPPTLLTWNIAENVAIEKAKVTDAVFTQSQEVPVIWLQFGAKVF